LGKLLQIYMQTYRHVSKCNYHRHHSIDLRTGQLKQNHVLTILCILQTTHAECL